MGVPKFIDLPIKRHLGCFLVWAVMHNTVINMYADRHDSALKRLTQEEHQSEAQLGYLSRPHLLNSVQGL